MANRQFMSAGEMLSQSEGSIGTALRSAVTDYYRGRDMDTAQTIRSAQSDTEASLVVRAMRQGRVVDVVLVPGASVPALFAAGMVPGILAGLALIVPAVWMARKHGMGQLESALPRPPLGQSLRDAVWGLFAPVLILGGMRAGWFTPTEAAVVAVFYGLFVGMVVHRSMTVRDLFPILKESGELSAVILLVVSLAGIFAFSLSTLGVIDPITTAIVHSGLGEYGVLTLLILLLITVGMGCCWRSTSGRRSEYESRAVRTAAAGSMSRTTPARHAG